MPNGRAHISRINEVHKVAEREKADTSEGEMLSDEVNSAGTKKKEPRPVPSRGGRCERERDESKVWEN